MKVLDLKLLRDLRRLWAQCLAIALVLAAGVMQLVIFAGLERSLVETREAYYERNRFAHVFATAVRAPEILRDEIAAIPGVLGVETRIVRSAVLDLQGVREPGLGQIVSLGAGGALPLLNVPLIAQGRLPGMERPDEVVVSEKFAEANGFRPGDSFVAILDGQRRDLTVTGTALSPEFIYAIPPGAIMPDDRRFGILWMPRETLEAAFGLRGAFNAVALQIAADADEREVIAALDRLLEPYGGTGAVGRDLQMSHSFIDAELEQLRMMMTILPPVFFAVAAFLVNMVLSRLIALEREQIGLLKALGYTQSEIGWHYVKLALLIGIGGVAIGWGAGLWGGRALAAVYQHFFHFPFLIFVQHMGVYVLSGSVGLATVVAGAFLAVRRVLKLTPAVAMAPPAPTHFRRGIMDRVLSVLRLRQTVMMVLRNLLRWPLRAGLTMLGLAMSCAVLVASLFMFDSVDEMMDAAFFQANRQDATIAFSGPRPLAVLEDVAALPGVLRAEAVLSKPVRLRAGPREKLVALEGLRPGNDLARVLDARTGRVVAPGDGLVLGRRLAEQLGIVPGQAVEVEFLGGARSRHELVVSGLVTQYFGLGAYMDFAALNRLLDQAPQVSAVHVSLDEAAIDALYDRVKQTPAIGEVTLWTQVRASFDETLAESAGITTTIATVLAGLIVVGVAYNAARIQLSERARELAGLRILGFTRGEVSLVLMGELAILTLIAIPIGFVIGIGIAEGMARSLTTDLYEIPAVVGRGTLVQSGLTVAVAAAVSALVVRRRIDRFDLVAVMKTRE